MRYYCTLFDSNYLYRGIAMCQSLKRHSENFHIYIYALDSLCEKVLHSLALPFVTIIPLVDLEDEDLLQVKPSRSVAEYCWTLTAPSILYSIEKFSLPECTYIDADLFFFSSPEAIFSEIGDKSVLITPHNFSEQYRAYSVNGIYNVQFMYFKNDDSGLQVLKTWREQCLDWCFAKLEDGKLGDQKYLDVWPQTYACVHVLEDLRLTLGPWNIQQFQLRKSNTSLECAYKSSNSSNLEYITPVLYHFHGMSFYKDGYAFMRFYELSEEIMDCVYIPYLEAILQLRKELMSHFPRIEADFGAAEHSKYELFSIETRMQKGSYSGNNILVFDERRYKQIPGNIFMQRLLYAPGLFLLRQFKRLARSLYFRFIES